MQQGHESDLRVKWHMLSEKDSALLRSKLDLYNRKEYVPRHLLGVKGLNSTAVIDIIHAVYGSNLKHPEQCELPLTKIGAEGEVQALIAGRVPLATVYPGRRFDVLVFMQAESVPEDVYNDALDKTFAVINRLLAVNELPSLPSFRDEQYPLDKLSF